MGNLATPRPAPRDLDALVALAEAAVQYCVSKPLALASTDNLEAVEVQVWALAGLDLLEAVEVQVWALAGLDLLEAVEVQEIVQRWAYPATAMSASVPVH